MKTDYDEGLSYDAFKARGESGEYRPDLDRYFLAGMRQPPVGVTADQPVTAVVETVISTEVKASTPSKVKVN